MTQPFRGTLKFYIYNLKTYNNRVLRLHSAYLFKGYKVVEVAVHITQDVCRTGKVEQTRLRHKHFLYLSENDIE